MEQNLGAQAISGGRLYVLDMGNASCDKSCIWKDSVLASIDNQTPTCTWITIPIRAFYIEHPKAKILFESGCAPNWKQTWSEFFTKHLPPTRERFLKDALEEIKVYPDDIDYMIMGHLHPDHSGGLPLFSSKKAKIVVQRDEIKEALMQTICNGNASGYIREDIVDPPLNWMVIDGDYQLLPGVQLVSLRGHTAGTMGMMVTLENSGTIICTTDAVYTSQHFEPPAALPGLMMFDSIAYTNSIEKLRRLVQQYNAQIFYSHDPNQKLKIPPAYYD
jgi:N-acyl homoserine lactone hydrolase